jgi:NADPH:quinone reductase-like Zn-dependent oxidoreductase
MKTEAFQLIKNGDAFSSFERTTIELNDPKSHEVQITVDSFGLNYADVMARRGLYREAPPLPAVIGYEVVGTITKTGSDIDSSWYGKRVVAFTRFGGYAKAVNTNVLAVAEIENMDAGEALCLATQYVTAYYMASYLLNVHENEKVLVHAAAGGVGTALIQLLKLKKAYIIAKTGSDAKIDYLKEQGADYIVNYKTTDYGKAISAHLKGGRIDVSFNPVAGSTFKTDWKLIGSGGRVILFGGSERSGKKWGILSTLNFVGKMGLIIPIGLMMRSKNVLGVNMLKVADNQPMVVNRCLNAVLDLAKEKKITPKVGASFLADELSNAHQFLESGESTGKVFVTWD